MSSAIHRGTGLRRRRFFLMSTAVQFAILLTVFFIYFRHVSLAMDEASHAGRHNPAAKFSRPHRSLPSPESVPTPHHTDHVPTDVTAPATREPASVAPTPTPTPSEKMPVKKKKTTLKKIAAAKKSPAKAPKKVVKKKKAKPPAPVPAQPEENPEALAMEPYQPMSIKSVNSGENSLAPEELSPVIADFGDSAPPPEPTPVLEEATLGEPEVVDASVRQPLATNPLPTYPQRDRLLSQQGTVVLIGDVDAEGAVSNVQMESGSGSDSLDQAAIAAFTEWKFTPGAAATVRKSFAFVLKGETQIARSQSDQP